ncbi:uncharacterized protein STAUR_0922 [Stigmatella aurantiaca DW4/3-1]|uniref:Lipoprotein n=1 Tax=Stigmatella aurantiaca (strain DW4/3-1) TaxID=378806 RepID=E3FC03_STIAD|nr:uncharacterized protein STAUR_0922 [Stigmatella aurantiaca DW4/3-1]
MKAASFLHRLTVWSFSLVLSSCGATHYSAPRPSNAQELPRFALIIHDTSDAQASHSWESVSNIDLSQHLHQLIGGDVQRHIIRASCARNCEDEFDACVKTCVKSLRGPNWSHANQGSKAAICRGRCFPTYTDCCRQREQAKALKFPVVDQAVDWLKSHREEILVGTVVVIAGVAFVVVVAGSGGAALILVPAVLLISSDISSESTLAAIEP